METYKIINVLESFRYLVISTRTSKSREKSWKKVIFYTKNEKIYSNSIQNMLIFVATYFNIL